MASDTQILALVQLQKFAEKVSQDFGKGNEADSFDKDDIALMFLLEKVTLLIFVLV